jgi:hypothetical protein
MARMGHDSERAAIIYQHEARGADLAITSAINAHIETAKPARASPLTWHFVVERVTGIEPALSAWESVPSGHPHALTCEASCPL